MNLQVPSMWAKAGTFVLFGDGLLQHQCREMMKPSDAPPHLAEYDLGFNVVSWDFFTFLLNAELVRRKSGTREQLRINLKNFGDGSNPRSDMSAEQRAEMLHNVVEPLVVLFGGAIDPTVETDRVHACAYRPLVEAHRRGERVPFVPQLGAPDSRTLTITVREATYVRQRNSDLAAWVEFARRREREGYEVVFVRDTAAADEPVPGFRTDPRASRSIWSRLVRYSTAFCNLATSNGPTSLLLFSEMPFVLFVPYGQRFVDEQTGLPMDHGPQLEAWWERTAGFRPPDKFPWLTDTQRIEWERDTIDNIERG
jgi:hypothetical protein